MLVMTRSLLAPVLLTTLASLGCGGGSSDETGSTGTVTQVSTVTLSEGSTSPDVPTTSGGTSGEASTGATSAVTVTTTGDETGTSATTGSSGSSPGTTSEPGTVSDTTTDVSTSDGTTTGGDGLWDTPNLWYAVDKSLIYVELSPIDGSVVQLVHNELVADVPLWHGQNGLTMLEDGTLLGSRESAQGTQIYHIPMPSTTTDTPAAAFMLGVVPGEQGAKNPRIEALYTDCDGRIYLMDTGVDVGSVEGNRLLRFNGKYLQGELGFDVVTDLGDASVADIDDMSPGIFDGEISDGLGFAMDSTDLWKIDYTTGTGMKLAETNGTWGIHALGGPLFMDLQPRLYILSSDAELIAVALDDYSSDMQLIVGPDLGLDSGYNGWSGLAGPLTECMTTIPQ